MGSGGDVLGTDRQAGATIRGQLTPMTARTVQESWGLDMERPHQFLCDAAEQGNVIEGDYLECAGRRFIVKGIQIWDAEPLTACLAIAIDEMA